MNHDPGGAVSVGATAPAEPLLKLRGIDKHFGPVQALYQVNLDLPAGQVTGLCGDNGAGKVGAHALHRGSAPGRPRADLLRGAAGAYPHHPGRGRPGDRDRVPGPGPGGQPGHRPEHVPGPGAAPPWTARRGLDGAGRGGDVEQPAGDHGAVHPPAGGLALGRPAPVGGGCQGGDVELQGGPPRRADRSPGGGPDRGWCWTWCAASATGVWR